MVEAVEQPAAAVPAQAALATEPVVSASNYLREKHPVLQGMFDLAWKMRDELNPAIVYLLLHLTREVLNGLVNSVLGTTTSRENQKKILETAQGDWNELEALTLAAIASQPGDPRIKQRTEAAARLGPSFAKLLQEETGRERIATMLRTVTGGNLSSSDPTVVSWHKIQRGVVARVHFDPEAPQPPALAMAQQLLDRLTQLLADLASKPTDRLDAVDQILQELNNAG